MPPLRVPDNVKLIGKEKVLKMPPQDRERYYEKVILDILLANREGATANEISSNTGFAERTIKVHLDKLAARGEAYAVSRGGAAFYFARGLSQEKALTIKSKTKEGLYYVITNLKNAEGDFFYIQQKELDEYRALRVKGAIMIAKADGQDFIKQFHTHMAKELERE